MNLLVGVDGDGNFLVNKIIDRAACYKTLKAISDGDHWINTLNDLQCGSITLEDINAMSDDEWYKFLANFYQRGMLQQKTLAI